MQNHSLPNMLTLQRAIMMTTMMFMASTPDMKAQHIVEVYYLYTNEYSADPEELEAVSEAIKDVQAWYQIATGGLTFEIANPDEPIIMALQQNSMYYYVDFVGRIYNEIFVNGPLDDEFGELKVFFVKGGGGMATGGNGCNGSCGIAWIGMDIFPEFNTGMYFDCPDGEGGQAWPCTPYGALTHELGHGLGMPHPFDTYPVEISIHSVMHTHWLYPYYYATEDEGDPWSLLSVEKQFLQGSPFLIETPILIPQPYEEIPICNIPDNGPVPEASYSYEVDGLEVTFTNTSEGAELYYWTFGNGDVSTEENPVYEYSEDGVYAVRLRATSSNGMMDLALIEVPVCNMNTSISASETEICSGEEVVITATGGDQYEWNTGANTSMIVTDPFETYDFEVSITASNGCWAIESITIYVDETPEVEILTQTGDNKICAGGSITLESTAFGDYLWSNNETDQEITVSPQNNTLYTLTVTDDNGCTGTDNILIEVFAQPVANIVPSAMQICPGDSVTLNATGGTTYLWGTGETGSQIAVTPDTTTIYDVTVFNGVGIGCEDTATVAIEVWPAAQVAIDAPMHACDGDSITLTGTGNGLLVWSTGDSTAQIGHILEKDTSFSLSVTTANGCVAQTQATILVHKLLSTSIEMSDDTLCVGEIVILTAPAAVQYQWSTGDSTASIQYTIPDTLQVMLTVIDSNQCPYALISGIYVFPPAQFEITGPSGLCAGDTIVLQVPDGFSSYLWTHGSDTSFCQVSAPGYIAIDVVDSLGCAFSKSTEIEADDTQTLVIAGDELICEGDTASFNVVDGYAGYHWSTGLDTNSIEAALPGWYSVTVTGNFGCTHADSIYLDVDSLPQFELMFINGELLAEGLPAEPLNYLWSDNSTGPVLTVSVSGTYCLTVTNANGCSFTSCMEVIISSGTSVSTPLLRIYPNPFTDHVYIEGDLMDDDVIVFHDIMGIRQPISLTRMAKGYMLRGLNHLPEGMYFIHVMRGNQRLALMNMVKAD